MFIWGTDVSCRALRWGGPRPGCPCAGASLGRSALRANSPAMLADPAPRQNSLRELRSLRSNSRRESDVEARVSFGTRAGRVHCASRRPRGAPAQGHPGLGQMRRALSAGAAAVREARGVSPGQSGAACPRGRRLAAGAISGAARSAALGACTRAKTRVPRELTRRSCLSGAPFKGAQRVLRRSPQREHRSGVDAQHRPPRYEPRPPTACRATPRTNPERT